MRVLLHGIDSGSLLGSEDTPATVAQGREWAEGGLIEAVDGEELRG